MVNLALYLAFAELNEQANSYLSKSAFPQLKQRLRKKIVIS